MSNPLPATESASAFKCEGVSARFHNVTALNRVSVSVNTGERVAFVGPSGAGKTTLLRLLSGMCAPTSGSVTILGEETSNLSTGGWQQLRKQIGFIYQDHHLVPNLRAIQNVLTGRLGTQSFWHSLRTMIWPNEAIALEAASILKRVGIGDKCYQRTDRLSGGEQQRVAIARTIFQRPKVILADEPIASVDPARARDTLELLLQLADEHEVTLCVSLHQIELARALFPRLVGIRDGEIEFDSAAEDVSDEQLGRLYQISPNEVEQ